jgi:Aerotolerance regulator N-terminal
MIWGAPAAAWALLALAVPILIHTLVRRRANPTPFPTLRFIPQTRLASIERRALEDVVLLAIRLGVLTAAVAAVGSPLLIMRWRRAAWDAVTIRAEVVSGVPLRGDADRSFSADTLSAGIREALVWLEVQPPGRRLLIVRSAFPIGAISAADMAAVPATIGLRFERTGTLPATSRFPAAPVLERDARGSIAHVQREIVLDADRTSVRDTGTAGSQSQPIEIVAPVNRPVDDVLTPAFAGRVSLPTGDRTARMELIDELAAAPAPRVDSIRSPWMADAVARIWRDTIPRSPVFQGLVFAAEGNRLVVRVDSAITDSLLNDLTRSVLAAMATDVEQPRREIFSIPDAKLNGWSRDPGPAAVPPPDQRPRDGRWFWLLSLGLLAVEVLIRRSPRPRADPNETPLREQTRVA